MAGNTRMLAVGAGIGAVVIFVAGIGVGYALHDGGKSAVGPAIAATSVAATETPGNFSLSGKLTLASGAFEWNHGANGGTPCVGWQGYSDITTGTTVVITDQGGTIIATGQLDQGSATVGVDGRGTSCTFTFEVERVPYRPFYGVMVSHRGTQTYSKAQALNGEISLTLG